MALAVDKTFEHLLDIAREPVKSSHISSIGFDETLKVITIEYANDTIYGVLDCEREEFEDFYNAESKGKFFHANLEPKKNIVRVF